ncbi:helix-turn-helix domain-containing protein [uncultured Draconibacterium sp.]|uniref:helix-turn-helix domain-containing protein n=1 Tax=uncultured Draconibacterium sp. TaxID=1573823 RepID=UPI0032176C2B
MQTNKQLELAYDFVQYTGQNIFLTGKAGTGKTTFLRSLKERSPKRMIVVAPTGVAAINAGGVTIHSFFQLSFAPQVGTENEQTLQKRYTKGKINIIRSLDLLVIDEISMVRADVLDAIDRVMRRFKNGRKPFGGAQVLMIGDLQQLSPVVKNEEWGLLRREYETVYFFSSKVLKHTPLVSIELTHVFRQQDDHFIAILNKVRDNKLDEATVAALNKRHIPNFVPGDMDGYITLCTHNVQAQRINDSKLRELHTKSEVFRANIEGNFPEYSYPTESELKLKVGAQVMFVKNDPEPEKQFYNGKIGKVAKIDDETVYVKCPGEEFEIAVSPLLWENVKYSIDKETSEIKEEIEGAFKQMPLKLAWAITIHKSQGLTFEKAVIDAEASFAHGQVYVALSRCKTLEGMVLSTPISERSIINDRTVGGFIQSVEENQPGDRELTDAKFAYQKELLTELFNFYRITYLVNSINKLADENLGSFPEVMLSLFTKMRIAAKTELQEVADKFQKQLKKYLEENPDAENNDPLKERLAKASDYFSEKLEINLVVPLAAADLDIDNKAVKKQLKHTIDNLLTEVETKLAGFEVCKEGFDVKVLLNEQAKASLDTKSAKGKAKKAKPIQDLENIPHLELYKTLRAWRYEKSSESGIPAYMIFSQKALIELVNYLPIDTKSLQLINGLGAKKIENYGADILQIIQLYCDENEIERGLIPLKETPKKEKKPKEDTKKVSFELFQSGKTPDEIATERALSKNTIESHLAHFVKLGELEVTHFLEENKLKKITDYFVKTENKSFGEAKAHFGDEVSYGELRMGLSYLESLEGK